MGAQLQVANTLHTDLPPDLLGDGVRRVTVHPNTLQFRPTPLSWYIPFISIERDDK